MKKLPYIEDYIQIIGSDFLIWPPKPTIINLARYDVAITNSMSEQITKGIGFTDKQAILAYKLVIKYRKQWNANGYDVSHLKENSFRLPIRQIDRRQFINIIDGEIQIRFPYDQSLIGVIRAAVSEIPGRLSFDRDKRCWVTALIEPRLIWAKEFGTKYNFSFGSEFEQALHDMLAQADYNIQLMRDDSGFLILNAADSLNEYIQQSIGFEEKNLLRLIDMSSVLGYNIDPSLIDQIECSNEVKDMLISKEKNLKYKKDIDLTAVVEYANLTNRYPIYVYETGQTILRQELSRHFSETEIIDRKTYPISDEKGRVIYFGHWKLAETKVPLLVTTHTLMIGHRRQQMIQNSEKIMYYTQEVSDA